MMSDDHDNDDDDYDDDDYDDDILPRIYLFAYEHNIKRLNELNIPEYYGCITSYYIRSLDQYSTVINYIHSSSHVISCYFF